METVILNFAGEDNKTEWGKLKDFVEILGNGHPDLYLEVWGYHDDGYVAKIALKHPLPHGEFSKACELCNIENGTLHSIQ